MLKPCEWSSIRVMEWFENPLTVQGSLYRISVSSFKGSLCRDPLNSLKGILVRRSCEFLSRISVWRSKDIAYPKLLWPHCLGSLSKIVFKVTQLHWPNAWTYLDIMFLRKCHNDYASLLLTTASLLLSTAV